MNLRKIARAAIEYVVYLGRQVESPQIRLVAPIVESMPTPSQKKRLFVVIVIIIEGLHLSNELICDNGGEKIVDSIGMWWSYCPTATTIMWPCV
jgi:hypothetical protein